MWTVSFATKGSGSSSVAVHRRARPGQGAKGPDQLHDALAGDQGLLFRHLLPDDVIVLHLRRRLRARPIIPVLCTPEHTLLLTFGLVRDCSTS